MTLSYQDARGRSQRFPYFDAPGNICSSSDTAPRSANSSAHSFSRQPAWLFTFKNDTVAGHERSALNRGTSTSKLTMSRAPVQEIIEKHLAVNEY